MVLKLKSAHNTSPTLTTTKGHDPIKIARVTILVFCISTAMLNILICSKFQKNISKYFKKKFTKGNKSVKIEGKITVPVLCTLSYNTLY